MAQELEPLSLELFLHLNPKTTDNVTPPSVPLGHITITCTTCGQRMRPIKLIDRLETNIQLNDRIWLERRWLVRAANLGTFCPLHLPALRLYRPEGVPF